MSACYVVAASTVLTSGVALKERYDQCVPSGS